MSTMNELRPRAPLAPSQDALRQRSFRIAGWLVEPTAGRAVHPEHGEAALEPDQVLVLVLLADRAGGAVPLEVFRATLWPGDENPPLEAEVAGLCERLRLPREGSEAPIVAHEDGYRLTVPVELIASESGRWHTTEARAVENDTAAVVTTFRNRRWWLDRWPVVVAAGTFLVIVVIAWLVRA